MNYIFYLFIIIIYCILTIISGKKYNFYYPTPQLLYPNNREAIKVLQEVNNRNLEDIHFFFLTDKSVVYAFRDIVPEISLKKLFEVSQSQNYKISLLKKLINRARPKQIINKIDLLPSQTANTPAFPAGHAAQAYILANYLTMVYPSKKYLFEKVADRCNDCRIKAGLHYPSDGLYSKLLFYNN